jgi:intracellular septation protein
MTASNEKPSHLPPVLKLALEMGPLVVFFLANAYGDRVFGTDADQRIYVATGLFMVAVLLSLVVTYALTRSLPVMPLITAVVVVIFGGLTLYLRDDTFIKMKPTIVNTLFGLALGLGLFFKKNLLKIVLDTVFELTEEGWRQLTWRWMLFFFFLAVLNEAVWRTQTTDFWVAFKVWGTMPITLLFAFAQVPVLLKHQIKKDED